MSTWYYYGSQKEMTIGPLDFTALQALQAGGVLNDETLVWRDNDSEWIELCAAAPAPVTAPAARQMPPSRRVSLFHPFLMWGLGVFVAFLLVVGGVALYPTWRVHQVAGYINERVLQADALEVSRGESTKMLFENIRGADLKGCPLDFQDAFKEYVADLEYYHSRMDIAWNPNAPKPKIKDPLMAAVMDPTTPEAYERMRRDADTQTSIVHQSHFTFSEVAAKYGARIQPFRKVEL